jgi:hypothetical protein
VKTTEQIEKFVELRAQNWSFKKIEKAVKGLDPIEKFIVDKKYMTGRNVKDVNIYTHPRFEWGKMKYYEFKDNAIKKIARILGYMQNGQKMDS